MSLLIGILDASNMTDNIIVIDVWQKKLIWIPRDLYIHKIKTRINEAFHLGGHSLFMQVVRKLGYDIKHSLCIPTSVCANVFADLKLTVPINEFAKYYYPLEAFTPIEFGKKIISFIPPMETLTGERIHQFLGARNRIDKNIAFPDFDRILRQQVFIKCLLDSKFNFNLFLDHDLDVSHPDMLLELRQVDANYKMELEVNYVAKTVNQKSMLFKKTRFTKYWLFFLTRIDPLFRGV